MLPKKEITKVINLAKKFKIGKVYLIGSAAFGNPEKANDYDFAIDSFQPKIFFNFYGKLFEAMPKNVDLIDLSGKQTLLTKTIKKEGVLIYESRKS